MSEAGKFYYAGDIWTEESIGFEVRIQLAEPSVSSFPGAHSLGQIAEQSGSTPTYTIELGWNVDPGLYAGNSPTVPHLFLYLNKDDYVSNGEPGGDCYNCHFVPIEGAKYSPGEAFAPTTGTVEFSYYYYPGNQFYPGAKWFISFAGNDIGYVPASFWPGGFSHAPIHQAYGEVYDSATSPTTQMGDGAFGTKSTSTKVTKPLNIGRELCEPCEEKQKKYEEYPDALHNPPANVPTPSWYSIGGVNAKRNAWRFGGPGV